MSMHRAIKIISPNLTPSQDGFTSLAHPWSSGPTQWLSEHVAGFASLAAQRGRSDAVWRLQPHLSRDMNGVIAKRPLPDGRFVNIGARVATACRNDLSSDADEEQEDHAMVVVGLAKDVEAELHISEVLAARLVNSDGFSQGDAQQIMVMSEVLDAVDECETYINAMSTTPPCQQTTGIGSAQSLWSQQHGWALLQFSLCCSGALKPGSSNRSSVAVLDALPGQCVRFRFKLVNTLAAHVQTSPPSHPNPFPPAFYSAYLADIDQSTGGNWMGSYGDSIWFPAIFLVMELSRRSRILPRGVRWRRSTPRQSCKPFTYIFDDDRFVVCCAHRIGSYQSGS